MLNVFTPIQAAVPVPGQAKFEEVLATEEELDAFMADHESLLAAADAYERESLADSDPRHTIARFHIVFFPALSPVSSTRGFFCVLKYVYCNNSTEKRWWGGRGGVQPKHCTALWRIAALVPSSRPGGYLFLVRT